MEDVSTVRESKRFGPKAITGRLFVVDIGEIDLDVSI